MWNDGTDGKKIMSVSYGTFEASPNPNPNPNPHERVILFEALRASHHIDTHGTVHLPSELWRVCHNELPTT